MKRGNSTVNLPKARTDFDVVAEDLPILVFCCIAEEFYIHWSLEDILYTCKDDVWIPLRELEDIFGVLPIF